MTLLKHLLRTALQSETHRRQQSSFVFPIDANSTAFFVSERAQTSATISGELRTAVGHRTKFEQGKGVAAERCQADLVFPKTSIWFLRTQFLQA
ncbi:hypothetical protein Enr13x_07430 [Stieleria neptunia]|uniref:Uncharacterized protein n=1 Tax=Stieleria neptunia TaxID=2527979 RepID=A0A518HJ77_9BACT|nr:hypothetical protein Enr13x_07430 [Stieleria neptunia]